MPAKIPDHLIKLPAPTLDNLALGESVYVAPAFMHVSTTGECYLYKTSNYADQKSPGLCLRVTRFESGFHAILLRRYKFEATSSDTLSLLSRYSMLIPVASFVEDYDPEFEQQD